MHGFQTEKNKRTAFSPHLTYLWDPAWPKVPPSGQTQQKTASSGRPARLPAAGPRGQQAKPGARTTPSLEEEKRQRQGKGGAGGEGRSERGAPTWGYRRQLKAFFPTPQSTSLAKMHMAISRLLVGKGRGSASAARSLRCS
ncbi:UNVERIFIED_CONTAM: hypothetical protein K2H54_038532 [Gekko kuhli]